MNHSGRGFYGAEVCSWDLQSRGLPESGLLFVVDGYTTNSAAIALYRKAGFTEEGLIRKYRKLDGVYFDCLNMAKIL